jgi:hypothetical protein
VHDVRLKALVQQPASRLEAEQSSTNDGRTACSRDAFQDAMAVIERAKHEHATLEPAIFISDICHRRDDRTAAGRNDELVVPLRQPSGRMHSPVPYINLLNTAAGMKRDAV